MNPADRVSRIGLLGGTFDPPHMAHLALAKLALSHLHLDQVRWMPAGRPWQKMVGSGPVPSQAAHRLAMVSLAIQDEPRFVLDDREVRRQGPSYTVDTLRELRAEHPDARWFLIIGQDQLGRFDTWKDWRQVLQWATLAVAPRSGQPLKPPAAFSGVEASIEALPMPEIPVSSTELRRAVSRGEDISPLAGEAIAGYIAHHHLYQDAAA